MKFTKLFIFGAFGLFASSISSANTCLTIQGTVQTQAQSPIIDTTGLPAIGAEQVGTITVNPTIGNGNLMAFMQAFGQPSLTGGIHGVVTNVTFPNGVPTVILDHEIGIPGIGSLISIGDQAPLTGAPDAYGNVQVTETGPLAAAVSGGKFTGWTGQMTATGVIGVVSGQNGFTYTGKLCKN